MTQRARFSFDSIRAWCTFSERKQDRLGPPQREPVRQWRQAREPVASGRPS